MFCKILIKVFYLARLEFTNNTVPKLFVWITILMSKVPIKFSWKFITVFDKTQKFVLIQGFD